MMKTVLIVEDERLIRKELRIMAERSEVPIGNIIECASGEEALEIIKKQKIDVMMTDINMDGMSGIELVKSMQELPHKPLTFAVSGYDEFTYAVEMMHYGVRGYILKPVEQEKITEFLKKFEAEIEAGEAEEMESRKMQILQLRYYLLNDRQDPSELTRLKKYITDNFPQGYYVCCMGDYDEPAENAPGILIGQTANGAILVTDELPDVLDPDSAFHNAYIGISSRHEVFDGLKEAYREALGAWKTAFCENRHEVTWNESEHRIPEALIKDARKMLTEEAGIRRVQIVGGASMEEMLKYWNYFFQIVKSGRISPDDFLSVMPGFFDALEETYKTAVTKEELAPLRRVLSFYCLQEYSGALMEKLLDIHERVGIKIDYGKEKKKILEAEEYIRENYTKDLNMATVSNYIQMNYSMFSYAFKQYTGKNFVNYLRDLRMEEAKKLLRETDVRINEISLRVGYANPKHFMKTFKGLYGVSPSDFRNNARVGTVPGDSK